MVVAKQIEDCGYAVIPSVYSSGECRQMIADISDAMKSDREHQSIRESKGTVFAARNVVDLFPQVQNLWRQPTLVELLKQVLGNECGLVRVLYFDKPSDRSWSLPFHKDMTIAVRDNQIPTKHFSKPTNKAGVPHVEGSEQILANMLTLRIHLDPVTDDNGPLQVIPGSHLSGKKTSSNSNPPEKILTAAGDVLAMRPLLSHASGHSNPQKQLHRRILHLEFAGDATLPDGYEWHFFQS